MNKTLYNTTGLEFCTKKCKTDKPYLVLVSGNSKNFTDTNYFKFKFVKDIKKLYDKIIVKFLYFYTALSIFIFIVITYIFCVT
jgi:hypothetical protein